jgi:hypothetical protein
MHLGAISLYKKKSCLFWGLLIYKIQVGIKSRPLKFLKKIAT